MDGTFTKETPVGSSDEETKEMPSVILSFHQDDEEESDGDVESGSLPAESASLGKTSPSVPPKKKIKPTKNAASAVPSKRPPFVEMVIEAVIEIGDKKGASVQAIRTHIKGKYAITDGVMKSNLKKGFTKAIENEMLIRPTASKDAKGMTGRFKVNPEYIKNKAREEKKKQKDKLKAETEKAKKATKKPATKAKKPATKATKTKKPVNVKELKSLGEKSLAVKLAKERIKQARESMGLTPNAKPKPAPKKIVKKAATKSPKVSAKAGKAKPKATAKTTKGASKEAKTTTAGAKKKTAAAGGAKKKTAKAK